MYGPCIPWDHWPLHWRDLAAHRGNRSSLAVREKDQDMTLFSIIGLIVAAGLVIYLFAALLKPEWFS